MITRGVPYVPRRLGYLPRLVFLWRKVARTMDPLTDQKSPSEQEAAETPGVPALQSASDFLAGDFEQMRVSLDQMRGVLSSAITTLSEGFSLMHEQNEVQRELLSRTLALLTDSASEGASGGAVHQRRVLLQPQCRVRDTAVRGEASISTTLHNFVDAMLALWNAD